MPQSVNDLLAFLRHAGVWGRVCQSLLCVSVCGPQLMQCFFSTYLAVTDKALDLPPFSWHRDQHHDGIIPMRGQGVMDMCLLKLFQKARQFVKRLLVHLSNLFSTTLPVASLLGSGHTRSRRPGRLLEAAAGGRLRW